MSGINSPRPDGRRPSGTLALPSLAQAQAAQTQMAIANGHPRVASTIRSAARSRTTCRAAFQA